MIKADMLDAFNDEELGEVKVLADKLLKHRDEQRKAKALEEARATLAAAGLSLRDLSKARIKPAKGPSYKGGHAYQHPTNKSLVWRAKGQKPVWLRELEAGGGAAVEVVNDNVAGKKDC
jgi:predicted metal-binding transcription factor (methanogenesis marker protein 9)